jgi:hypothetical protein
LGPKLVQTSRHRCRSISLHRMISDEPIAVPATDSAHQIHITDASNHPTLALV